MTWTKLQETPFKAGYRRLLTRVFAMPYGRTEDFTIKDEGRTASLLALTPDGEVILTKQFRPGPEKVLLELPGGMVEPNETPLDAAKRELLEETGFQGELEFAGMYFNCAYSNRECYSFVARNCVKVQEPQLDQNEFIELQTMSLTDFHDHLRTGELTDVASGYLCLEKIGYLRVQT